MKIPMIESCTNNPNKLDTLIRDKNGAIVLIIKATIKELLSLAEGCNENKQH